MLIFYFKYKNYNKLLIELKLNIKLNSNWFQTSCKCEKWDLEIKKIYIWGGRDSNLGI